MEEVEFDIRMTDSPIWLDDYRVRLRLKYCTYDYGQGVWGPSLFSVVNSLGRKSREYPCRKAYLYRENREFLHYKCPFIHAFPVVHFGKEWGIPLLWLWWISRERETVGRHTHKQQQQHNSEKSNVCKYHTTRLLSCYFSTNVVFFLTLCW